VSLTDTLYFICIDRHIGMTSVKSVNLSTRYYQVKGHVSSGVTRNFVRGEGRSSTNSVEERENGDLGAVAP